MSGTTGQVPAGAAMLDAALVQRLVTGGSEDGPASTLETELIRRGRDPAARGRLRRLLGAYASAAPEYVDEDVQAIARRCLALLGEG